jgi:two-component system, sensor histidine kinase and response regulator
MCADSVPAVDFDQLKNILGELDPQMLREIFQLFEQESRLQVADVRQAILQGDAQKLYQTVHKLKGSCLAICAVPMVQLCSQLEVIGKCGTVEGAVPLLKQVQKELEEIIRSIKNAAPYEGGCR